MIGSRDIARAVEALLDDGVECGIVAKGLGLFLARTHLTHLIPHILRHLERTYTSRNIYNTAAIAVGREKTVGLADRIVEKVAPNAERHTVSVDDDLIGGFHTTYQRQVTDASVQVFLDQLRTHLYT